MRTSTEGTGSLPIPARITQEPVSITTAGLLRRSPWARPLAAPRLPVCAYRACPSRTSPSVCTWLSSSPSSLASSLSSDEVCPATMPSCTRRACSALSASPVPASGSLVTRAGRPGPPLPVRGSDSACLRAARSVVCRKAKRSVVNLFAACLVAAAEEMLVLIHDIVPKPSSSRTRIQTPNLWQACPGGGTHVRRLRGGVLVAMALKLPVRRVCRSHCRVPPGTGSFCAPSSSTASSVNLPAARQHQHPSVVGMRYRVQAQLPVLALTLQAFYLACLTLGRTYKILQKAIGLQNRLVQPGLIGFADQSLFLQTNRFFCRPITFTGVSDLFQFPHERMFCFKTATGMLISVSTAKLRCNRPVYDASLERRDSRTRSPLSNGVLFVHSWADSALLQGLWT